MYTSPIIRVSGGTVSLYTTVSRQLKLKLPHKNAPRRNPLMGYSSAIIRSQRTHCHQSLACLSQILSAVIVVSLTVFMFYITLTYMSCSMKIGLAFFFNFNWRYLDFENYSSSTFHQKHTRWSESIRHNVYCVWPIWWTFYLSRKFFLNFFHYFVKMVFFYII